MYSLKNAKCIASINLKQCLKKLKVQVLHFYRTNMIDP